MPSKKPPAAGANAQRPIASHCSIAGMSSDQTEAATITPEAKPSSARLTRSPRPSRSRKTHAAPSAVPRNGSHTPISTPYASCLKSCTPCLQIGQTKSSGRLSPS